MFAPVHDLMFRYRLVQRACMLVAALAILTGVMVWNRYVVVGMLILVAACWVTLVLSSRNLFRRLIRVAEARWHIRIVSGVAEWRPAHLSDGMPVRLADGMVRELRVDMLDRLWLTCRTDATNRGEKTSG